MHVHCRAGVEVVFAMLPGSVEVERRFPVMAHIKSKPRNRLDTNISLRVRMFSQALFDLQSYPWHTYCLAHPLTVKVPVCAGRGITPEAIEAKVLVGTKPTSSSSKLLLALQAAVVFSELKGRQTRCTRSA